LLVGGAAQAALTSNLQGWEMMMNADEPIFVGVDVAKAMLEIALDDKSRTKQFNNDEGGIEQFLAELAPMTKQVAVVLMEATGGLERPLALALCMAGYSVMVVNPRQAREFAKSMGHLAKTDSIDAKVLSHYARTLYNSERRDRLLMKLPTVQQDQMAALVSRRAQLVGMLVAESNRLGSAHPTQRKSIQALMRVLEKQISQLEADIGRDLQKHFKDKLDLLKGMKGVGPNTQAVLMGSLGELGQLTDRQISKLAGVAPLNCDSGKQKGKRITWGGRADVRSALYMATLSAIRCDPVIKEFYQRLKAAGKPTKVALTACMHKLLRIINAVIRSGKPWQPGYQQAIHT
jgi:transposase